MPLFKWLFRKKNEDIYGSASFLEGWQKRQLLSRWNKGLCIDGRNKISRERSYQHLAVIAPTGAGKTTRLVIPSILQMKGNSIVVTDPSGEIFQKTAGYLKSQDYAIRVLSFFDAYPSQQYNPLYFAQSYHELQELTSVIIDTAFPNTTGDQFWNDGAKSFLNILARCTKKKGESHHNLSGLYGLVHDFNGNPSVIDEIIDEFKNEGDTQTVKEYQSFVSQDSKVISGIVSTAKVALSAMSDPVISNITSGNSLDFRLFRSQKTAFYIIVPEHKVKYYSFIISLLYTQLFGCCISEKYDEKRHKPIFFFLDEFGNLGKIPNFSTIITVLRKRCCSISLVLQDIEQLVNVYGRADASVILNGGCSSRIFYPGLGLHTCEELERLLGKKTVSVQETGYSKEQSSLFIEPTKPAREKELSRSLMTADEIRTMSSDRAIFIHSNFRPVLLKTIRYFEERSLLRRSKVKI